MTLHFLLVSLLAVSPDAVGIGNSRGAFRIAGAPVIGTGSVTDGAVVETESSHSLLRLKSGARVELAANSRAQVFGERVVLEAGASRVSGPVSVMNSKGVLLARLTPGRSLDFSVAAASAALVSISGVLELKDGVFWVTDTLTQVPFRVSASGGTQKLLQDSVGSKVSVEGTIVNDLIEVSRVSVQEPVHADKPASSTAPVKTASAAKAGVSKVVIAGVAIAGGASGALVGLSRGGDSKPTTQTISQ